MSLDHVESFKKIIIENNYRLTKARLATFKLLISSEPQTIGEVLSRAGGKVDRVSIYRNVELFERLGIVNRIYIGFKYKLELSDSFVAHHHHMSCLDCGVSIDIEDERHIDDFIQRIAARENFAPRRHTFEIDGYCSKCSKK